MIKPLKPAYNINVPSKFSFNIENMINTSMKKTVLFKPRIKDRKSIAKKEKY